MHRRMGGARILIVLLALRVVDAPIAARPDPPRPPSHSRFVVRVCAWPAQRPQRVTAPAIRTREWHPAEDESVAYLIPPAGRRGRGAVTASAVLLRRLACRGTDHDTAVHLSDCPRC